MKIVLGYKFLFGRPYHTTPHKAREDVIFINCYNILNLVLNNISKMYVEEQTATLCYS